MTWEVVLTRRLERSKRLWVVSVAVGCNGGKVAHCLQGTGHSHGLADALATPNSFFLLLIDSVKHLLFGAPKDTVSRQK